MNSENPENSENSENRVLHLRGPVLTGADDQVEQAWVIDGRVSLTAPSGALAAAATTIEGWVLPGLVDAHNHIGLGPGGAVDVAVQTAQAVAEVEAGVLLVRDAGSAADTRWIDERPDLPRIVRAGRHIARTRRYIRNYAHEVEPEQLAETVRQEARRGDGWVKLVGDWIDRDLGDLAPCWPLPALREAIAAAHEEGARVTAHCFGEDCLADLMAAGIDCIEHATGLADDDLATAARLGVAIVPTLINIANFPKHAADGEQRFPTYAAHMRRLYDIRHRTIRDAYDAGVPIYVGTDAGGSMAHGLAAAEIAELIQAGLPVTSAIDAACWGARSWLRRPGLGEGDPADLVVLPVDPRTEPEVLAHPTAVVLRGRIAS